MQTDTYAYVGNGAWPEAAHAELRLEVTQQREGCCKLPAVIVA